MEEYWPETEVGEFVDFGDLGPPKSFDGLDHFETNLLCRCRYHDQSEAP